MQEAPSQSPSPANSEQSAPDDSGLNASLEQNVARLEQEHEEQAKSDEQPQEEERLEERAPVKPKVPKPGRNEYQVLHEQRVKNAAERQELAKARQEIEQARKAIESGKRNPAEALKAMGYADPREFLEMMAKTGGEITPEQQKIWELEERISKSEKEENERREQFRQQQERAQYESQVGEWHRAIRNYVDDPQNAKWNQSLVSLQGQEPQVLAILQEQHDRYGENLDIREGLEYALDTVNRALEKQMRQGISQIAANPRGRAILAEIVGSSQADRSPSRANKKNGLNGSITNQTSERKPDKDLSLDEMVELNSRRLRNEAVRF